MKEIIRDEAMLTVEFFLYNVHSELCHFTIPLEFNEPVFSFFLHMRILKNYQWKFSADRFFLKFNFTKSTYYKIK